MRNNNGFTLIEMVITITVISIIFAIAVPRFDINTGYMEKMANEFAMDVRYVQMENMKNPDANYEIEVNAISDDYYVKNGMSIEKSVAFKSRYTINYNNGSVIRFSYEGAPIKAGTFTITDTKTGDLKQVTIVPATGRTIILE